jgi:hypothetical protein
MDPCCLIHGLITVDRISRLLGSLKTSTAKKMVSKTQDPHLTRRTTSPSPNPSLNLHHVAQHWFVSLSAHLRYGGLSMYLAERFVA